MGRLGRRYVPWLAGAVVGILVSAFAHAITLLQTTPPPNELAMVAPLLGAIIIGFRVQRPLRHLQGLLTGWWVKDNYWLSTAKKAPWWMWTACVLALIYAGVWTVPGIFAPHRAAGTVADTRFLQDTTAGLVYLFILEATILYSLMVAERSEDSAPVA